MKSKESIGPKAYVARKSRSNEKGNSCFEIIAHYFVTFVII